MSSLDVDALLGDVYNPSKSNEKKEDVSNNDGEHKNNNENAVSINGTEDKEKEKEKSSRKRQRSQSPEKEGKEKRSKSQEKKETQKLSEEELQAEQDARTVFASGLPTNVSTKELREFFEKAGKVKDISLISDRNSRRSKGIGYIEYAEKSSVTSALALSGTVLNNHTVIVQATMAEKNRALSTVSQGPCRIYFSNVDLRLIEQDLEIFFEPCGEVKHVEFYKDEDTNKFIGSGYVDFRKPEEAKKAVEQCNGFKLLDKNIKVGVTGFEPKFDSRLSMEELDGENVKFSAQTRFLLMNRLSQRPGQPPIAPPMTAPIYPHPYPHPHALPHTLPHVHPPPPLMMMPPPQPIISTVYAPPVPSNCILLTNMFNPIDAVGDPNFEAEMKEEVEDECKQFGNILHLFVDKNSHGHIYIKFDSIKASTKAIQTLNGRYFAGNQITAEYMSEAIYNNRFGI